jgi:hypothetical protein
MITEHDLNQIESRVNAAQAGPWKSFIENRDHESGDSFIMTGEESNRGEDIYLTGATIADQDFIASARQDIPILSRNKSLERKNRCIILMHCLQ